MAQRVKFDERWIDIGGIRTRYIIEGTGEPVLFLHGGQFGDSSTAECAEVWNLTIPQMSDRYTCIAVDRLGQGFTDSPTRDEDYTMAASIEHTVQFIRAVGIGPCHVVGHSRAGYVVARLTIDQPQLVRSCTIVSSNTLGPGPASNEVVFSRNPHPPFSRERSLYVLENYSYSPAHIEEPWLDLWVKALQSDSFRAGAERMADRSLYFGRFLPALHVDRLELYDRIAREGLRRPTLIVWSRNDGTTPVAMALAQFRLLAMKQPRTELHLLNGAGHYCFRERAPEFGRTLRHFLERCEIERG